MATKKSHAETIASLEKRLAVLRLRERVLERKATNRKRFLLGHYIYSLLPDPNQLPEALGFSWDLFQQSLARDGDRQLFGLPPIQQKDSKSDVAVPEARTDIVVPIHQKDSKAVATKTKKTTTVAISAAKRRQARDLIANGVSLRQAALKLKVSKSTLSDVLSRGK